MKLEKIAALLLIFLLFLAACRKAPVPPAMTLEETPAREKEATLQAGQPWEIKWEKVKEAAKKEGIVRFYSSMSSNLFRDEAIKIMKGKYGLSLEMLFGRSAQVTEKIMTERRASLYLADVHMGGISTSITLRDAGVLAPLKPLLILPEVTDPDLIKKIWRWGDLHWKDNERRYILGLTDRVSPGLAYNTELVKPGELQSYWDLLNPKWKRKIIMYEPFTSGSGQNSIQMQARQFGWDYFVQLARQEPIFLADRHQMAEWIARGKYAILWGSPSEGVQDFINAGAPIKWGRLKEPTHVTSGSAMVSFVNRSPHPNAATVFINWILTKEAADILVRGRGTPGARLDATLEGVPEDQIPDPNVKYIRSDIEGADYDLPEAQRKIQEIFGPLRK